MEEYGCLLTYCEKIHKENFNFCVQELRSREDDEAGRVTLCSKRLYRICFGHFNDHIKACKINITKVKQENTARSTCDALLLTVMANTIHQISSQVAS